MVDENVSETNAGDENYLGDWKDKDAATVGLANMQEMMAKTGDEVGTLRKQAERDAGAIEALKTVQAPEQNAAPDLSAELQEVQTKMLTLDTADADYTANMVSLMGKQTAISNQIQHEQTLKVATERFSEELSRRDVDATTQEFKNNNAEFDTPEMQAEIQKRISADKTGMVDSLVAFREIQRDTVAAQAQALTEENEKLKKLANLKEGTDSTGNVYTGSGQSPAKQLKTTMTNAERDQAMLDAVMAAG